MLKIRRLYNQNRSVIWKVVAIIVFLFVILQVLNYFAGRKHNIDDTSYVNNISNTNQYTDLSISTDKSVLSNNKISSSQKDSLETVNSFFSYCNEKKIQQAYELLTDECKEEMYPKLEDFKKSYYDQVFGGNKKNISVENWIGNIYKIYIDEDFLSTGNYSTQNTIQDYITIKELEDNNYKLNINGYIDNEELNKSFEYNDISFDILTKKIYMDYEIYTFKITNKRGNSILLDNLLDIDSMYIEDSNGIKYSAYTHEISPSQLLITERETREIPIKYYNKYGSEKRIEKIVFSKLILDYNSYNNIQDKNLFNNYFELKMDIYK